MTQAEISAAMAQGRPLLVKTSRAVEMFGMGRTSLYRLRREHPDFRALTIKTGREVLFDVPRVYEWFQKFGGRGIE